MSTVKENFPLNPKAKIFEELKSQQPEWWTLLCNDKDLYIEIRKDNYISVYYYGGSLAKICYSNDFVAKAHQKYLGDNNKIDLTTLDEHKISEIKKRIKKEYLQQRNTEKPKEKWIQGEMIKVNPDYIDSEFQFNKAPNIGDLRIDLVELSDNTLTFIELKGIFDTRLRNDVTRNTEVPEIIKQMKKYKLFINNYEDNIIEYYQKLIEIKSSLSLPTTDNTKIKLNKNPKLIIVNTYSKMTKGREKRICDIEKLLEEYKVDYKIIPYKNTKNMRIA